MIIHVIFYSKCVEKWRSATFLGYTARKPALTCKPDAVYILPQITCVIYIKTNYFSFESPVRSFPSFTHLSIIS